MSCRYSARLLGHSDHTPLVHLVDSFLESAKVVRGYVNCAGFPYSTPMIITRFFVTVSTKSWPWTVTGLTARTAVEKLKSAKSARFSYDAVNYLNFKSEMRVFRLQ
jgi:hypothetical protein